MCEVAAYFHVVHEKWRGGSLSHNFQRNQNILFETSPVIGETIFFSFAEKKKSNNNQKETMNYRLILFFEYKTRFYEPLFSRLMYLQR